MKCEKCGTVFSDDMHICPNCGADVFESLELPESTYGEDMLTDDYLSQNDGFIDESLLEEEAFFESQKENGGAVMNPWFKPTQIVEEEPPVQAALEPAVPAEPEPVAVAEPEPTAPVTAPAAFEAVQEEAPKAIFKPATEAAPQVATAAAAAEPVQEVKQEVKPLENPIFGGAAKRLPDEKDAASGKASKADAKKEDAAREKAAAEKAKADAAAAKATAKSEKKAAKKVENPVPAGSRKKSPFVTVLCVLLAVIMVAEVCVAGFWKPGWFRSEEEVADVSGNRTKKDKDKDKEGETDPENEREIPKDEISEDQTVIEQNGITIDAGCLDLAGKQITAVVKDNGSGTTEDGAKYHEYDISLGDQHEFDDPVCLHFPAEDPENTIIKHYDAATDTWTPLATYPDLENGGVFVLTRSFTPFRAEEAPSGPLYVITDKGLPTAKLGVSSNWKNILLAKGAPLLENALKDLSTLKKDYVIPVPEIAEDQTAEQMMDSFNTASGWWSLIAPLIDVSVGLTPMEKPPLDIVLVDGRFAPYQNTFRADLSEAMTDISILTMGLQIVTDSYQHGFTSQTTALNAYKNLMTNAGTFYSMWTGYGSPALTLGFLGVTIFSMQLDYMVSGAQKTQVEISTNVFNSYYENIHPFDADYWYKLYVKSFWQSNMDYNAAIQKVNEGIDQYVNEFWEIAGNTSNENFIFAVAESKYKNFFELSDDQKKSLSDELRIYIRRRFAKEALPRIERFVMERIEEQLYKKCWAIVEPFNEELKIQIKETVKLDSTQMPRYRGCVVAFGKGDKVITNDGWTLTTPDPDDADTDDGWSIDFECTSYGWMCANLPDTLYVYASKDDMNKKATPLLKIPFELVTDPAKNRTTVINLSDAHAYGWALTKLTIKPNYEPSDPVKVLDWSGDISQIEVHWKETVDNKEKEYTDITVSFGHYADYPEEFIYAAYYDSTVDGPSDRSQNSASAVKVDGKWKNLAKEGYYPNGENAHKFTGTKVVPNAEEGKTITVAISRGVYSLIYEYTAVPVDEQDSIVPKIVNNCKNGFELKDFIAVWYLTFEENGKEYTGYLKLEMQGNQVNYVIYDEEGHTHSTLTTPKMLDEKTLRLTAEDDDGNQQYVELTLKDKDHISVKNGKNGAVTDMIRKKG
ncbi:MAG: hypothetical protein IKG93_08930 [Clostridiales bacterium]|nr:hypothetical protein [Clostridiales bacterium]